MNSVEQVRARRSRLILVGESIDAEASNGPASDRIVAVPDLFDAVGCIATGSAREPIEAVVIDGARLRRSPRHAVDAIRSIDPGVLVYLIIEDDDDPIAREGVDSGLDGLLYAPVSHHLLLALLDEPDLVLGQTATEAVEVDDVGQVERSHDDLIAASLCGRSDAMPSPLPQPIAAADARDHLTTPPTLGAGEGAGPSGQSASLGDTDLVEAILQDPESFVETALRLIVQETGWHDLYHSSRDTSTEGVEVQHGENIYGRLCSDMADAEQLRSWAQWLGTWMTLARSHERLRTCAYLDALTGAWNRRYFEEFLPRTIEIARTERRPLSIVVFDVDDLKQYNDRFGHDAGDDVLCETVRLIRSMIRRGDRLCRIGGDEFVVIFADHEARRAGSTPLDSIEQIVRRFQQAICELRFPKLGPQAPGTLSISAGMATYPWDGHDAESLLRTADHLAIESKRRGKNLLTIGQGSSRACE